MKKNMIFDCSDTLLHMGAPEYLKSLVNDDDYANELHFRIFRSFPWHEYDCGKITSEELKQQIIPLLKPEEYEVADTYLHNWNKHYSVIDGIPELLAELKEKGCKLYLLSDFPPCFEELWNKYDLFRLFDGRVISYEEGVRKSDEGALFKVLFKKNNLIPEECIFVDDGQINVDTAENLGLQGILFTDVPSLRKALGL
ncbi:MAG: HAD-IA family hydrolase [Clostridia bacterium]|nr:HAD-IA family hydrolase [Clostridia bacterium]